MFQTILLDKKEEGIYKLTLNRSERLNAITQVMTREIIQALEEVSDDPEARALIFTGAGRGFCAGADLRGGSELTERGEATPRTRREAARFGPGAVVRNLLTLELPTIAMVNGPAAGGGFDFALACDIRTGSENARFVQSFMRLGMVPALGGAWLMPHIMGLSRTARYLFTGDFIEAQEAYRVGMLDLLVPAAELDAATMDLAQRIARIPPITVRLVKKILYKSLELSMEATQELISAHSPTASASEDRKEALAAFMEKRTPVFKGK